MPVSPSLRWSPVPQPVIGMLHLLPLPGSPQYGGQWEAVRAAMLRDAEALVEGGIDALMLENFGDVPFFPGRVPPVTVAGMTALALDVRRRFDVPLGINVLRNDGQAALAVAQTVGAAFIRVNVLCGARVTDQGLIQGIAHDLLRERAWFGAAGVQILADVNVKHSAPLAARPLADEVADAVRRGGADAVIVSGRGTGQPTDLEELTAVRGAAGGTPVLIGSGITAETVERYLPHADGLIVGTSLKRDRAAAGPVDSARVRQLMQRVQALRTAALRPDADVL